MAKSAKLNEVPCPACKVPCAADATRCPHCQIDYSPDQVAARKKEQSQKAKFTGIGCAVLALVLVLMVATCSSSKPDSETPPSPEPMKAIQPAEATASNLTVPQRNAARSASQYLGMTGFSKRGLIGQLSSNSGDDYAVSDATVAVESLNVDWNEQAVRSAKQYLEMSGFSCKGLIEQLSSDSGDEYTRSEATYGAKQAGAC